MLEDKDEPVDMPLSAAQLMPVVNNDDNDEPVDMPLSAIQLMPVVNNDDKDEPVDMPLSVPVLDNDDKEVDMPLSAVQLMPVSLLLSCVCVCLSVCHTLVFCLNVSAWRSRVLTDNRQSIS